ncbi:MAG: glycosyltransferase [Opitutaceae bacterium]|nr:glycosyltransferase [Opitutaceae bacterium]
MIYFDVTKSGATEPHSGLTRVSSRLREEMGSAVIPVTWDAHRRLWRSTASRQPVALDGADWLLTAELFSDPERPGLGQFILRPPCRLAAVFHDAIPLKLPHITWPQSVQRHPEYMKLLAQFDRIWAVSAASAEDLRGFWRWQGVTPRGELEEIGLGADFDGEPRRTSSLRSLPPSLLCVGIIEPRKNQSFLLDVAEALWREGLAFDLHVAGRVNPHFGKPIEARMRTLAKRQSGFYYHSAIKDAALRRLYAAAWATVFPTIAEGCGLPLLESLWSGVPCVGSDLPVLRENAEEGGCLLAAVNDETDWKDKLRRILADEAEQTRLRREATSRPLPTWSVAARTLLGSLR